MVLPVNDPTRSYWIEAAASPLRDFRSTAELPEDVDVVIVGSGYTGASAAYWIHKFTVENGSTPNMLMLDARDVCGGATGRNGGQLRPHAYSRYPPWSTRFGSDGALELIRHEMAHLDAFQELMKQENLTEEVCLKIGETFDAAMTDEAWLRLKGAYDLFVHDHGHDGDVIRDCRLISNPVEAEEFTQMKGCIGAVVHPAGQIWPYKFVHALLRIVLETGRLNLQSNTPVLSTSSRGLDGKVIVTTPRGQVRAKSIIHATNRWASHLLPEFSNLIFPSLCTVAAIQAPEGFIKNTGAQHWDSVINNYHNQLPPPYNAIIVGGAKAVCAHYPEVWLRSDEENKQLPGVPHFYKTWPKNDIKGWKDDEEKAMLSLPDSEGGVWTGVESSTADNFPFVGQVPGRSGHFVAAGFGGHGMPRILLSTAFVVPLVLEDLRTTWTTPDLCLRYPPLPAPFLVTPERVQLLQTADVASGYAEGVEVHRESAKKAFCNEPRCLTWKAGV